MLDALLQRDWMQVGIDHNGTDEQKTRLAGMFDRLEWQEIGDGLTMAMGPGLAIKSAITELRMPKVTDVANSHELAPFGLIGIRAHYKNGRADAYICDEGSRLVVLAVDFYPVEPA